MIIISERGGIAEGPNETIKDSAAATSDTNLTNQAALFIIKMDAPTI